MNWVARLVNALDAQGMMGDVVVQIRKAQKQLEHFINVGGAVAGFARGKGVSGVGRVGEKPVKQILVDRLRFNALAANLFGALNHQLDEVIEANALSRERGQNAAATTVHVALFGHFAVVSPYWKR